MFHLDLLVRSSSMAKHQQQNRKQPVKDRISQIKKLLKKRTIHNHKPTDDEKTHQFIHLSVTQVNWLKLNFQKSLNVTNSFVNGCNMPTLI